MGGSPSAPIPSDVFEKIAAPDGLRWESYQAKDPFPKESAVKGGEVRDGNTFYIGRVGISNNIVPGRVDSSNNCLYILQGLRAERYTAYEVLVQTSSEKECYRWVHGSGNIIRPDAIKGGWKGKSGKPYYIGRRSGIPGALDTEAKYFWFSEKEVLMTISGNAVGAFLSQPYDHYEILVSYAVDEYRLTNVKYEEENIQSISSKPEYIDEIEFPNKSSVKQRIHQTKQSERSVTASWRIGESMETYSKVTVKAALPKGVGVESETGFKNSFSHESGQSTTHKSLEQVKIDLTIPPRSLVKAKIKAHRKEISVPFTATLERVKDDKVIETIHNHSGVFHGVQISKFVVEAEQEISLDTLTPKKWWELAILQIQKPHIAGMVISTLGVAIALGYYFSRQKSSTSHAARGISLKIAF